ncbi:hypothetical protein PTKIN_Ptkin17bG0036300 [Pterospermum kingtungense]
MKKAIGQTVRDLKREVNKKVLKVPGIEQKVLDATSNEPWGPHGSLLADIAMATRNYHEYQMIMGVLWKRINDTGKNWRHVYKALTVLEYLVAHGSERVIDDIREHAYQISILTDFQYIDSSGRDQGSNVRKKSQSLVVLVNDKERIIEVRQKAAANRDKFGNTPAGGMYRPGSGGYGDKYDYDRYGSRAEDQNGYGRDREYGRDDDRYGRYGDSNSRDGDRYGRDYEDRYSRDGYRDDDYRGRRSVDGDQYGTRSRSSDRDRAFDDDGASSRGSGAIADDRSQDGGRIERKFSEQKIGAPPSYEEALSESQSPVHGERDGETSTAAAPRASSPLASAGNNPNQATSDFGNSSSPPNQKVEAFDEFDPRGSVSAAATIAPAVAPTPATSVPTASTSAEMDLLGALSDSLAIVPTTPTTPVGETDVHANSGAIPTFPASQSASNFGNQGFDDPFGDVPFKALPSTDAAPPQLHSSTSLPTFLSSMNQNAEVPQPSSARSETVTDFNFGDSFSVNAYSGPSVSSGQPPSSNLQFLPQKLSTPNQESDILADILPPYGPANDVASHAAFSAPTSQSAQPVATYDQSQQAQSGANMYSQPTQPGANPYGQPAQSSGNSYGQAAQPSDNPYSQAAQPNANPYGQPAQPNANPYGQPTQPNANPYGQPTQPDANPYSQPAQPNANPYGQPTQPHANPYSQPAQPNSNPYSQATQPNANPYSQPAQPNANPYSQPAQPDANPYDQLAQQNSNAYGQPAQPNANPYGQPVQLSGNPYAQPMQPSSNNTYGSFNQQTVSMAPQIPGSVGQSSNGSFTSHTAPVSSNVAAQSQNPAEAAQFNTGNFLPQQSSVMPVATQGARQTMNVAGAQSNNDVLGGLFSQPGSSTSMGPQSAPALSTGELAIVPQPSKEKEKFAPKSAVWADTLSRGLVNLNISGPKINPLADIGVDFDAINRKEKRREKPAPNAVTSTVTMGQAMGAGSGIGRAGASTLRAPANPMVGSGMSMGMGGGPAGAMGMGGYGGMNQQPMGMGMGMNNMGMGMGMGMNNMGMNPGMGMNMGMGQGAHMQPQTGMPGSYNPMMGSGGYSQQPYGGYR